MTKSEAIEKLLAQCAEDKGVVEQPRGSNRGARVQAMLKNTGLGGGYPWCAAAVTTWGIEALGSDWPVRRSADCDAILAWARKNNCLHKTDPKRGDLFLVMKNPNDAIHIGVVSQVISSDYVKSWEGNTNDGGSRDGYGVFHRSRSRHNLWYVRWADVFKDSVTKHEVPALPLQSPTYQVRLPHGLFPKVQMYKNRPCAPIRPFVAALQGTSLEATGEVVSWDAADKRPVVNKNELVEFTLITDPEDQRTQAWAPVRDIAEALGFTVSVEGTQEPRTVFIRASEP